MGWGEVGVGLQEGSLAGIRLHLSVNRAAVGNGSSASVLRASAQTDPVRNDASVLQ